MKRLTLIVVPGDATAAHTFRIPRFVPKVLLVLALALLYVAVFFSLDYFDLRKTATRYRELSVEHEGVKSEIRVLVEKLSEVKRALKVVQNYTAHLDELTQIDTSKINTSTGIGPLSDAELNARALNVVAIQPPQAQKSEVIPAGIDIEELTFSPVLQQLSDVGDQARRRTFEMQRLLSKLDKKRSLLSSIPSIYPVKGWVSSGYGYRVSPFTGERTRHRGMDIASAIGTPILAPADGVVIFSGRKENFGNFIMIAHGYGIVTRYGHNAHNLVQPGQKVKRGDQIGTVGASGRTTGPHLHYEVWVNGNPSNPRKFILSLGEQHLF